MFSITSDILPYIILKFFVTIFPSHTSRGRSNHKNKTESKRIQALFLKNIFYDLKQIKLRTHKTHLDI